MLNTLYLGYLDIFDRDRILPVRLSLASLYLLLYLEMNNLTPFACFIIAPIPTRRVRL